MHIARPVTPRLEPIPSVAAKAREAMADLPVNAVNLMATMAHNRTVARGINQLAQAVMLEGDVPRRQLEIAVLRMGWNCRAEYEFGQHTLFARETGLTDAEISATTRPISDGAWSDADRAVLRLVDDLYTDDCLSDSTWDEATRHFSSADMVQLIAAAGCYRLVSGFLNSAGVQLDDGVPGWPSAPTA
jgi:alkylhydroperoxidase family enzyme